jgi:hypothetical protein
LFNVIEGEQKMKKNMNFWFIGVLLVIAGSLAAQTGGNFQTTPDGGNGVVITKYTGQGGAVAIPTHIDGKSVTGIGRGAFFNCTGLTSITIPDGVTSIGDGAFSGCSGLVAITIPDGVTGIGYQTFWGCESLTSVTIPASVTSIGIQAFARCTGLKTVTIQPGVITVGDLAFVLCSNLTSVTIPVSVTSIGLDAFSLCDKLSPEIRADIRRRFGKAAIGELF